MKTTKFPDDGSLLITLFLKPLFGMTYFSPFGVSGFISTVSSVPSICLTALLQPHHASNNVVSSFVQRSVPLLQNFSSFLTLTVTSKSPVMPPFFGKFPFSGNHIAVPFTMPFGISISKVSSPFTTPSP